MLVLDLESDVLPMYDKLKSYYGQPYIWCMLHNFGGTLGMFGSAEIVNQVCSTHVTLCIFSRRSISSLK